MKTKTFLLLCLFSGIGLTQLSAQNGKDGTGSVPERWTREFPIPVVCDGVQVDFLLAPLEWHHVGHYQKGVWLWCYVQISGEAVSTSGSGEIFTVKLIGKQDNNIITEDYWEWVAYSHVNLLQGIKVPIMLQPL